jgi:hypothetical protein
MRVYTTFTATCCGSFSRFSRFSRSRSSCGGSSRRHCCPALSLDLLIQIHEQLHSSRVRKDLLI